MPRILTIDSRVPTVHGVLIKRQAVHEQVRAYTTVQQARAHARRIIKEAQINASALEQNGLREGFQSGWLDSLNAIFNALSNGNVLHQQIEMALKQAVRKSLETSLSQPGLELQLLEGWLSAGPRLGEELHLVIPQHAQEQRETLKRHVEKATGIAPVVSVGEGQNIVIQSGDHIYEFSPERTLDEMNGLVNHCFQRLEVKKQCDQWVARIVRAWLNEISDRYSDIPDDEAEEESRFDDDLDDFDSESTLNYFKN
jgi:hypothetical protein